MRRCTVPGCQSRSCIDALGHEIDLCRLHAIERMVRVRRKEQRSLAEQERREKAGNG